jgi:hypothetical protein
MMVINNKVYVLFKEDILSDPIPMDYAVGIFSTLEKAQQEVSSDLVWVYNPVTSGYFTWEGTYILWAVEIYTLDTLRIKQ